MSKPERKFGIEFTMAPGDVFLLTALVRDIRQAFQGRYAVNVAVPFPDLWRHNPYLDRSIDKQDPSATWVRISPSDYLDGLRTVQSGVQLHFLTWYYRIFEKYTGIHVPCLFPGGDLHLTEEEKAEPFVEPPYWIVVPGGKTDWTTKWWSQHRWQELVDALRQRGIRCVQEGATKPYCCHPPLRGVLNLVGRTSIRDLIRNIYHAEGVICGISLPMHLAAALQKPCVVIAGGYESPVWEWYTDQFGAFGPECAPVKVPHRFLHTLGQLACCQTVGCWARRVVKLTTHEPGDDFFNNRLCRDRAVDEAGWYIPRCMERIATEAVLEAVLSYGPTRREGTLEDVPRLLRQTEQLQGGYDGREKALTMRLPPEHFASFSPAPFADDPLDHPAVGRIFTVSVLCVGPDLLKHQACLSSILSTLPPSRFDLRIATIEAGNAVRNWLQTLPATRVYVDETTSRSRALHALWHDPLVPITTSWIVHFDSAARVVSANLWSRLAENIVANGHLPVGGYGVRVYRQLPQPDDVLSWMHSRPWYRGRWLKDRGGYDSLAGDCIWYLRGTWLALNADAVRNAALPDDSADYNGDEDVVMGEQLHQAGYAILQFNQSREFVTWTDLPPRTGLCLPVSKQSCLERLF